MMMKEQAGQAGEERASQQSRKSQATIEQDIAPMVEIRGLKKTFGLKPVLRGIDLVIQPGEAMALLGANGAGKTTLLRLLAGLAKPGVGTIRIAGLSVALHPRQVQRLIGYVGHQPYLYEELTALENLLFFGRMYTVEQAELRAHALLQRVGLAKRMQERVGTFSRGQLQRLAWARALLHSPRLLLLDEPDTGLDQEGQGLVDILLREHCQQGGSSIFTTHQLERAAVLSDSIVMLQRGRVIYQHATPSLTVAEIQKTYNEVAR
jgi:heme ABC exporter ATP-binding subunit CcmA